MEAVAGTLVGRTPELAQLEGALDAAAEGRATTVLLGGEAGIGKTRLAEELAGRARARGFDVQLGRSLDLVGSELPYQPFVDALRPLGELPKAGSQLLLFEEALALVTARAATVPVLLVLEDLHWADTSTLDLVVFLAHNLQERRVLLLATYRAGEPGSAERMRRLDEGVLRSGSAVVLELAPLQSDELTALLAARAGADLPSELAAAILVRSEGNPFFAEELLAAAGEEDGELPRRLRDLLLQRIARLDRRTQGLLRLAAAAGRDVGYALLRDAADLPEGDVRESLRRAVEHGILVPDHSTGGYRFRHALLAEAIYATLLPGEREDLHARLADELAGGEHGATAAELAPHWAAAGRVDDAFRASVEAAREAESAFGLAEAVAHLERVLALWPAAADPAGVAGLDLVDTLDWAATLSSYTGGARRALELGLQAIELTGDDDALRAAYLHVRLAAYLGATGKREEALAAVERAVELVPAEPPSAERAEALAALGQGLMLIWRHRDSQAVCEHAVELARVVGAREVELRAHAVLGIDLAYLGRGEEAVDHLRENLRLAEEADSARDLIRAYVFLTDVLTLLGRPRESARLAARGMERLSRFGIDQGGLGANRVEALVANGDWDEAERVSAAILRAHASSWSYERFATRAALDIGRGDFEAARAHLAASPPRASFVEHGAESRDLLDTELALWERRWSDAAQAVRDGLGRARTHETAFVRLALFAHGLRAQAELVALARARRDDDQVGRRLAEVQSLAADARRAGEDAAAVTPNASGWTALAEAEHGRALGDSDPEAWSRAAVTWDRLERPPLAAYSRWRQAEALVATGAGRAEAGEPLREAHEVASRIGARPLLQELELLAERARLDLTPVPVETGGGERMQELLELTPREAEVLALVARGLTNREIADTLVISVKTAGVHVSNILRKLDVPNRVEAAGVAHRLAPPG